MSDTTRTQTAPRVKVLQHLMRIFFTAAVVATIFNIFTPMGLVGGGDNAPFAPPSVNADNIFLPTPTNRPKPRIGLVAGHWGEFNDVGAVCPDGLTELEVNLDIALRTQQMLQAEGFDVDLFKEYDDRLTDYRAIALVSIHADTCAFYNLEATGFKVTSALGTTRPDKANRLVACIYSRYLETTELPYHASVTTDMSSYHAFEEINADTAAAIIETGFLNLDRRILTQQPELIAEGIANGLLCYIRNEDATLPNTNQVIP